VAWWATWPAETCVAGMVTDRVAYELFRRVDRRRLEERRQGEGAGKTFLPSCSSVAPMIKAPAEVTDEEVGWFLPGGRFPPPLERQ